jgi:hypothetical protein
MTRHLVTGALSGADAGLLTGLCWVPNDTLDALTFGTPAIGPARSLATVAHALEIDFAFVPAGEEWAPDAVSELREYGVASIWAVSGVLGRVAERIGWTEALRMTAAAPGELAVLLGEALHDALEEARTGRSVRADALLVADDLAGAAGPLVSPDFALDALLPCYRGLAREAAERALLPALARAGFSAVHLAGVEREGFEASFQVARSAGLVVLGGVRSADLLSGAALLGVGAGSLALAGGMLVCDDGGITMPEQIAAYASALDSARETYAAGCANGVDERL